MKCATILPVGSAAVLGDVPVRAWRQEFLGYFDTHRSSNGGTEAINGLSGLHRRIAHGFRNLDNYRLRMLLIAGGLHPNDEEPAKPNLNENY